MSEAPIVCLGIGRMGQGIAIACARAGRRSILLDVKVRSPAEAAASRQAARDAIAANVDALAEAGDPRVQDKSRTLGLIAYADRSEGSAALAEAEVVFEGVPEVMEVKRSAFAVIAPWLRPETIVASTSSSFLSTALAEMVPAPERFLNAHWLNPAFLIPLVELSPHPGTDPAVTDRMTALLTGLGKVPVLCAPAPGYIVPRLQILVMNEVARMISDDVATAEDIDRAIRFGFGVRYANMGIAEFIDFGGNDILHYASRSLSDALQDARFDSPEVIGRFMREGRNGVRTGRGFYDWSGVDIQAYRVALLKRLLAQTELLAREPTDGDNRPRSLPP